MNLVAMFDRAHARTGRSQLTAIGAVATWTAIPAGYTYDTPTDRLTNTSGTVLTVTSTHYAGKTTAIDYVPTAFSLELRQMIAAGLVPTDTIEVIIKTAAELVVLRAAWRVKVGSILYRMSSVRPMMQGTLEPNRIRLERQDA